MAGLVTGFSAWEFPVLTLPVRESFELLSLVRLPAEFMVDRTQGTLFAHRVVSAVVLLGVGAAVWQRRARA